MTHPPTTTGEFIRAQRVEAGLSQQALARLMHGVSRWHQQTVVKVEADERRLQIHELAQLARILSFDPNDLIDLIPLPPPCVKCDDKPPAGFRCNTCGRSS